jgi:nitrous oxidase accessory protein
MKLTKTILLLFLVWFQTNAQDAIIVSPDGEIKSIAEAVGLSPEGGIIKVMPGSYFENGIVIEKAVHISGVDHPIVDGSRKDENIFVIRSNNVIIEGLHIQNARHSFIKDISGINIQNASDCIIRDNTFTNTYFGIYMRRVTNSRVVNNRILGNAEKESTSGNALHLWNCKSIVVERNEFYRHRDGIYLEFTDSTHIADNIAHANVRYGLHYMFSHHNIFVNNHFRANGAGVAVMFSSHIDMRNNIYEDNWGSASYGMLLKEVRNGEISGSTFKSNTVAIFGESAIRLKIENNDFIENGWAMRIFGSCTDNEIVANNFIGNTFDISTNTSQNNNLFKGNYWTGYTGYDLDKDGVGDVPYKPVNLFSYLAERVPESIVLQRSLFVHIINFAEKVAPALTPQSLQDEAPAMKRIKR